MDNLEDRLAYDPLTGIITWKIDCGGRNGRKFKAGSEAGCLSKDGYRLIRSNGILYKAHRVAWYLHHGEFPNGQIDHINHVRDDNRLVNLRVTTQSENNRNSSKRKNNTGYHNVYYRSGLKKPYRAGVMSDGKKVHLGYFETAEEAHRAVVKASIKFGYHENHGK